MGQTESTTEDANSNSCYNDAYYAMTAMQPLSELENSLPLPPPPLETTDEIVVRRLRKRELGRERQRRFRARKRLQADVKGASLLSKGHLLQAKARELGTTISQGVPSESQSSATMNAFGYRFHCSRKWKTDARQAHTAEEPKSSCGGSSLSAKPPFQKEPIVLPKINPASRRHWKAEARILGM